MKIFFRPYASCIGLLALQLLATDAMAQTERGAYLMPYTRYEADTAALTNAQILQTTNFDISTIASEASQQKYVSLPSSGSSVEFTLATAGNGVTMRYTMPDSADGKGVYSTMDVYINGVFDQTINVTSHWAWQYFVNKDPVADNVPVPFSNTDYIAMRFDETHFLLKHAANAGDKIKIVKTTNDGAYGVDFIEVEPVAPALGKPAGYVSIADFGAVPDDGKSDLSAFNSAVAAAGAAGTGVYLPPGKWEFDNKVLLNTSNIGIKGAGMWYTQIFYTNPAKFSGGMLSRVTNVEISDIYFNTINNTRYATPGDYMIYKAFMGTYGKNSKFTRVWAEHFEVGAWLGGYDAPYPVDVTDGLVISYARFRNNYADGINFSQGTSNSVVEQTNIRNSGDDGLAMWPSNSPAVQEEVNNEFRYNTVEHIFRAGGVAIFGGKDQKVRNMLIRDCFGGPAIRFTTDFPGYTFDPAGLYRISDLDIYNCGTSYDLWHQKRGAVEFNTPNGAANMQFDNVYIKNSQRHGVQIVGNNFQNITFNNTIIDGTGLDAFVRNVAQNVYGGVGIYAEANSGTVTFNNASISNYEDAAVVNQSSGFNLVVSQGPVALKGISFASSQIKMANGDTTSLDVVFNPPQATNKNVTFTSSDPSVVSVAAGGSGSATLTALKVGSVTITAKSQDGGFTATTTVTVTPAVSIAVVNDSAVEGGASGSFKISAPQIANQIAVNYTISGTAASSRYNASPSLSGTVLLDPTHTEQVITIAAVDDTIFQGNQTLVLTLAAGTGYELGKNTSATVKIIDNEYPACTAPAISFGTNTPVVDGQVDAIWANAPAMPINNVTFGSKPAGYNAQWRAMSTATNLYVLVEVSDSTLMNDSGSSWWEDDGVELFIDGDNSKKTTYDHANDFQLGFRWNDTAINVGGNSVTNTTGIVQRQFRTATGYNIEVMIPWSTIAVTPQLGSKIGFDVAVDGDNDGGTRDSQMASNAASPMGWSDTSLFGSPYLTQCSGNPNSSSSSSSSSAPSSSSSSSSSAIMISSSSSSSKSSVPSSSSSSSKSSVPSSSSSSSSKSSTPSSSSSSSLSSSSSSASGVTSYYIINRWQNTYLCDGGDFVTYAASPSGNSCKWATESVGSGRVEIRNIGTNDYMNIENLTGKVQATTRNPAWDSSKWILENVDGTNSRIRNYWQSSQYIHIENLLGVAQSGVIDASWWSAQWRFVTAP